MELWADCWYKMFIIHKVGKYDQKIMGIFIHLKECVKSWWTAAPLVSTPDFDLLFPFLEGIFFCICRTSRIPSSWLLI